MNMREIINLFEDTDLHDLVRTRFHVLELDDLQYMAARTSAEEFADKVGKPEARSDLISLWNSWQRDGILDSHRDDRVSLRHATGVARFIADAIGATRYEKMLHHPFASSELMFGPGCYLLTCPTGRVFLDAIVYDKSVCLSQLLVDGSTQRTGLGTKVMNAIHDYALQNGLGVSIQKVVATARSFYDRFPWLTSQSDGLFYVMEPDGDRSRGGHDRDRRA